MARTKKVGITGRFGARYGRKAKRSVKIIEENMKKNHVCPKCDQKMWCSIYRWGIRSTNSYGKICSTQYQRH